MQQNRLNGPAMHNYRRAPSAQSPSLALTWAAAAGWRWMTIKPLPPDTAQGLHSSKQLSALQQPAQRPLASSEGHAGSRILGGFVLSRPGCRDSLPTCIFRTSNSTISPHCKVVKRHKQGVGKGGGGQTRAQTEQSVQRSPRALVPREYAATISRC